MKMNSLSDPDVIAKLYEASAAGVKIHLIVRGICCLKTEITGVSDNIEVHFDRWAASWNTAGSTTSTMTARKKSTWPALT